MLGMITKQVNFRVEEKVKEAFDSYIKQHGFDREAVFEAMLYGLAVKSMMTLPQIHELIAEFQKWNQENPSTSSAAGKEVTREEHDRVEVETRNLKGKKRSA